ncbi:histidine phosphatase family protein [Pseudonocardia sp. EC080619-01]|uniref:histidine phosphatase family protein n=1 Tax=Pseudonocardia sp. EC080619-01 TaxID=1096856 RepID=UPI001D0473B9|nr:histidine phosphatase family protein [Pseudonocardia sp. EC080619-01]
MVDATTVVFETHSWSEDNDRSVATGWLPGRLSERGRELAAELGDRRRGDGLDAVFSSDLERAAETTRIAFSGMTLPVFLDWRLRECDYGRLNGAPAAQMAAEKPARIRTPYPGGESWEQALDRVLGFLRDVTSRWQGRRVLVIGHVATRWELDHFVNGISIEELIASDFGWREGWEFTVTSSGLPTAAS